MGFEIIGRFCHRVLMQKRQRPTSALLMAERWFQSGVSDVRIVWNGLSFEIDAFCVRFELPRGSLSAQCADFE